MRPNARMGYGKTRMCRRLTSRRSSRNWRPRSTGVSLGAEYGVAIAAGGSHPADRGAEPCSIVLRGGSDKLVHASPGSVVGCFETLRFRPDHRQCPCPAPVRARRKHVRQKLKRLLRARNAVPICART